MASCVALKIQDHVELQIQASKTTSADVCHCTTTVPLGDLHCQAYHVRVVCQTLLHYTYTHTRILSLSFCFFLLLQCISGTVGAWPVLLCLWDLEYVFHLQVSCSSSSFAQTGPCEPGAFHLTLSSSIRLN